MKTIEGTLTWNTDVADNHGWLLFSSVLNDGAATIPAPEYYDTAEDIDADDAEALIEATLKWEGASPVQVLAVLEPDGSYAWSATVAD